MSSAHGLAWAVSIGLVGSATAGWFADGIVSYEAGAGGSASLTNPAAALGGPAILIRDPAWGVSAVDPFTPPYLPEQVVSVGAGGSLTVRFGTPIRNDPHPYGLDFIIHGNTMFVDTDYPNGQTSAGGSTFGENTGSTKVWVSADGNQFYQLNPSLTPVVDGMFPTDGAGQPGVPVNPLLSRVDFASKTLSQIRSLYGGSAGGTGYDLAWAQDGQGQNVNLASISFIRVEVLAGSSEIDAFAAVPEPAAWHLVVLGLPAVAAYAARRRRTSKGG
jgi:hypothetical protein